MPTPYTLRAPHKSLMVPRSNYPTTTTVPPRHTYHRKSLLLLLGGYTREVLWKKSRIFFQRLTKGYVRCAKVMTRLRHRWWRACVIGDDAPASSMTRHQFKKKGVLTVTSEKKRRVSSFQKSEDEWGRVWLDPSMGKWTGRAGGVILYFVHPPVHFLTKRVSNLNGQE